MFRTVFAFEIRYWLRQPMLWVLTALMALLTFGAVSSDNVQIGQSFDNLLKNAPYVVQSYYAYMSAIGLLIVTAFVQASALRDVNHRSQELIYTTPLAKTPYLLGRFFGAFTASLVPQLGVGLGILLGGAAPWVDPERVGPVAWHAHGNGFLAFSVPNTFIIAAVVFAIAALTRKTAATFVGAIAILVGYSVAGTLLEDLESEGAGALADTFAIGTYENLTKYWTVAERNSQSLGLTGELLLNRLLWVAVGAVILAVGVAAFRFTLEDGVLDRMGRGVRRMLPGRRRGPGEEGDAVPGPVLPSSAPLPAAALATGLPVHLRQMLSLARVDFVGVFRSVPVRVILLMAAVNVGFSLWQSEE
ncbi:MAG: hypothetical protein P8188_00565, partial [Gemmatimonadota bacterium]